MFIKVTFRIKENLYEMIKLIAKRNNKNINNTAIELLQNGIIKEMEVNNENS